MGKLSNSLDFGEPPAQLAAWAPESWPVAPDWQATVSQFLQGGPARSLGRFIENRLADGATVFPPQPFRALELTPLAKVRVVILGQDPYHGPGQAQGLAFSVAQGVPLPPSLRNIYKEIARDAVARGDAAPKQVSTAPVNGSLEAWARQGVLLLNTCLTVEQGQPASHAKQGWEALTDQIVKAVWSSQRPVVFMLWGAHAQARALLFGESAVGGGESPKTKPLGNHLVLTANHPSPLSALRPPKPFIGCGHFGLANVFLKQHGQAAIDW